MSDEGRLRETEEKYQGFTVYDNAGEKIGKVDELFVDEDDREEYIGVKMGFLGTKSTLIPMDIVRTNERDRAMEVAESKGHVREAPTYGDDDDITHEYEDGIRRHFGLESLESSTGRSAYSDASAKDEGGAEPESGGEESRGMLAGPDGDSDAAEQEGRRTRVRRRVTREETETLEEEEDLERPDS
jgi:hypothetical protein